MYLVFRLKFLLAFSEDFYTKKSELNPIKYSKNQQKILPAVPQVQYNKRKEECMDNTPYDDVFRTLLTDCTELKQLEAEYASIRERFEIACQMGDLNRYAKAAILDMSRKVIEHIAVKYKNVAKGVSRTMGGKVLNYEAKDILNRRHREGEEYTKIQIATKLLNMGNDIKSVAELAELPQETVEKLAQSISKEEK